MLGIPKKLFVAIGFLEALGVAAGMAAGGTEFKCSLGNNMLFVGVWVLIARYVTLLHLAAYTFRNQENSSKILGIIQFVEILKIVENWEWVYAIIKIARSIRQLLFHLHPGISVSETFIQADLSRIFFCLYNALECARALYTSP